MSWDSIQGKAYGCSGYEVDFRRVKVGAKWKRMLVQGKSVNHLQLAGLNPGKRYVVRVRMCSTDSLGRVTFGPWSQKLRFVMPK